MDNKNKETVSLKSILVKYLRQWRLFLIVFILSFIPAVLYLVFYPRTYEFAASVLLQEEKESSMASFGLSEASGLMKSFGIGTGGGRISIDDEIAILTSNRMLRMMILDLGLNVLYSKPYSFYNLYKDAPLCLTADSLTLANLQDTYNFTVSVAPGRIKVNAKSYLGGFNQTFTYAALPAELNIGPDTFTLDYNPLGAPRDEAFKLKIRCLPAGWMAEDIAGNIEVEEVSTSSSTLMLACREHSMGRGRDMLNTLIRKYNEDIASYKQMEEHKMVEFVDSRIVTILADLTKVESDIREYKTKNSMTILESDVTLYGETFRELQTSIIAAETEARQMEMLADYIRDPANRNSVIPSIYSVGDGGEKGMLSRYNEAIVRRDKFLKNANETNPVFRMADNEVEKLRGGIITMIENARTSVAQTLSDLKAKENAILSKLKSVPEKEREYINLRRNQEILQGIYLMLLQKKEETTLSLAKQMDRARVIEPAYMKKRPLGPRKLYAAIGILILTLVIPVGYLLAKDLFISLKEEYKRTE
jgi:uncharacterized protein involved in exopolysaccharide biosynthesis